MSVAQDVRDFIEKMDNGKLFSYEDIQNEKKSVVAIELSRLSKQGIVKRLSKGKYYKPKQGYFGEVPLSDNEVVKSYLAMPNTYVTGLKAFNEMGLTTQVPKVITIASEMQPRRVKIKNLEIQFVPIKQKINKRDIPLVRLLDALENINKIPDTTTENVIAYVKNSMMKLSKKEIKKISIYALKYRPKTKAILGALLELLGWDKEAKKLQETLNPLSSYKVGLSEDLLPNKKKWKII
jgi:hypothetical protein